MFAGRFTLEDVESVCTSDDVPAARALDLLSSLVDKSLVMREDAKGRACYRLHETMGEYTRLKLREAGEEDVVELRCADFYVFRCQPAAEQPVRYELPGWLEWMELEIDNIRSVLRRCLIHGDFRRGIDLACSIGWYWITRATSEGVRWLDELLASGPGRPALGGLPYFLRGFLAVLQSDPTAARPALARAVMMARDAGQLRLLAESLAIGSVAANMAGDRTSARRLLGESQVVAEGIDDVSAMLAFLQARALNGFFEGDLDTVRASSSEGVRLSRETGDTYGLEMLLINLGSAALLARELDQAQPLFAEALRISNEIDDRVAQYILLDLLGCHAASSGRARRAAQLLGAAEAVRTGVGATLIPTVAPLVAGAEASAIAALGASSFEAEFNAGKRLSRDAAIGTALGEPAHVVATPDDAGVAPLAKREADVARLVAEGLSNKQIGARLFISERTVDSHVRSILNKLGFNSRAQIAGWMASSNQ